MNAAMRHRGPDDEGVYLSLDGRLGMANRRLAIRDLSPAGHMPMSNEEGSVWITYNGEIYNTDELRAGLERLGYTFRSTSDTEIILAGYLAWGKQVTERLRGMFAFVIADLRPGCHCLFLARDPLGVKPLYYAQSHLAFLFASELKGLLASGLLSDEINPAGLAGYLALGSVPTPLTIYRDIVALEPASWLVVDLATGQSTAPTFYWHLPATSLETISREDAVAQVRTSLQDAVAVRLVSDVPLGAFLSGGLDSSSVVALMRQATNGPLRTCSMIFAEADYSEAPYARAVANAVRAEHFERVVTAQDMLVEFDHILAALDQPSVDGVNTYFVSQTARQAGLTVALSGLGGDELFGGYPNTFVQAPQMYRALRLMQAIPGGAAIARAAINLLPDWQRWARTADALTRPASRASAYLTRRGLFAPSEVQALLQPNLWAEATTRFDPIRHIAAQADSLQATVSDFLWTSRAELATYTQHQLLRDTDAMSMTHSLEVREPLLDVRLVEQVLRLPDRIKLKRGDNPKSLLVEAVGDLLPSLVRKRRDKMGFTFPFDAWLRGPLQARTHEALQAVQERDWLQAGAVERVWQDFLAGRVHWSQPWALAALGAITS